MHLKGRPLYKAHLGQAVFGPEIAQNTLRLNPALQQANIDWQRL